MTSVIDKRELDEIFKKLEALKFVFDEDDFEKVLAEAAKPAQEAIQKEIPQGKNVHLMKDDGGTYKRVRPGNLERSIQIFKAKRQKRKMVLVGAVVSKKSKIKSVLGAKRVSRAKRAFYWKFVNFGTAHQAPNRFMDRARSSSVNSVLLKLKQGVKKYAKQNIDKIFN